MGEKQFDKPGHYAIFARELQSLLGDIRKALEDRPIPDGIPRGYFHLIFNPPLQFFEVFGDDLAKDFIAVNEVLEKENVAEKEVVAAVGLVRERIHGLIAVYHKLWRRPVAMEYEEGRDLLSAVMEKVLRTLSCHLDEIRDFVEHPENLVSGNEAGGVRRFVITLDAKAEWESFYRWFHHVRYGRQRQVANQPPSSDSGRKSSSGAFSFLLGWFLGKNF